MEYLVNPEQSALPGMQAHHTIFDEPDKATENDREKRFEAERKYWQRLPVTPRMWMNHVQVVTRLDPLIQPAKLLTRADFARIRDEMALAAETARLPVLLERCTALNNEIQALRSQIEKFRPKLQILDWINQWPEINQREIGRKRQ